MLHPVREYSNPPLTTRSNIHVLQETTITVHEGDDLGQLFSSGRHDACDEPAPAENSNVICTISRLGLKEEKQNDTNASTTLADWMGFASSVYWRHFAYSLPHRRQHHQTTSYFNQHAILEATDNESLTVSAPRKGPHRRYGIAEALGSSLAESLLRVELPPLCTDCELTDIAATAANSTTTTVENEEVQAQDQVQKRGPEAQPSSLTIAITTCKRFHFFLPTFLALQEVATPEW